MKKTYLKPSLFVSTFVALALAVSGCADKSLLSKTTQLKNPGVISEDDQAKKATFDFNQKREATDANHAVVMDLPYFEMSASGLENLTLAALSNANAELDKIAQLDPQNSSLENTIVALDTLYYDLGVVWNQVGLIAETSNQKELKAKAKDLEEKLGEWAVEAESREDVYRSVKAYSTTTEALSLTGEDKKLLVETVRDFERIGIGSPFEDEIKDLKKEISKIKLEISNNIATSNKVELNLTRDEVEGLSNDQLDLLTKDENGYKIAIGISYQVYALLTNAKKEEVRKKVFVAHMSRAQKENTPLMISVIKKRSKLATLLGYATWADYKTENRMAASGQTAKQFIETLARDLKPKFDQEIAELKALKVTETTAKSAEINPWDIFYYQRVFEEKQFDLDLEELRKYFKYENALAGMFKIFEGLFNLTISKIDNPPYVWDAKVDLYEISDSRTGKPLGYLYLDMFPRPETEKYGHFASFTLRSGKILSKGNKSGFSRRPINALVCNFPAAKDGKPSLLSFDNVNTLFHEFGHALHSILSETKYASFAGTSVARDFVEAPSQMLENWLTDKAVLDSFAVNHQDPNDKIPGDILRKIKNAAIGTVGISYTRQFSYGTMDLRLHTLTEATVPNDIAEFTNQVFTDLYLPYPAETSFITSFGHLFGGYDAAYYGYAWADRLAADMASMFENSQKGFLDPDIGMRLRTEIYERGSSRDINESIEAFLLRKPNSDAFLKKLGIK